MKKYWRIGLFIILFLVIILTIIFYNTLGIKEINQEITIRHMQTFDSKTKSVLNNSLIGDFQWESTGYQNGGIGRIYNYWTIGNPRFGDSTSPSMHSKIDVSKIEKVTKEDCESAKYGLQGQFDGYYNELEGKENNHYSTIVQDGDVICFSIDENKDGIMGDKFMVIKILSHVDSIQGDYAESVNFSFKVFE